MPVSEFDGWFDYFKYKNEQEKKAMQKVKAKKGK